MLALHLQQNCMAYVNTLMLQRVLGEPIWLERMGTHERRAMTPLFWGHVNPYGTFQLDMTARHQVDATHARSERRRLLSPCQVAPLRANRRAVHRRRRLGPDRDACTGYDPGRVVDPGGTGHAVDAAAQVSVFLNEATPALERLR